MQRIVYFTYFGFYSTILFNDNKLARNYFFYIFVTINFLYLYVAVVFGFGALLYVLLLFRMFSLIIYLNVSTKSCLYGLWLRYFNIMIKRSTKYLFASKRQTLVIAAHPNDITNKM